MKRSFFAVLSGLVLASTATAATVTVVDFETVPVLAEGPSFYGDPAQTIVVPGIATFTGGTVLGLPSSFPGVIYATTPNLYATADFGSLYLSTLTIAIDPLNTVTQVSFALFNGKNATRSYVVTAFDGATQVAQQTFLDVPSNLDSGYVLPDLIAANITSVTIAPLLSSDWNFLIDTVAFNQSIQQAVAPEPGSLCLVGIGIAGVVWFRRRKVG